MSSAAQIKPEDIIKHLDQAREVAFSNPESYPAIFRQVLLFTNNPNNSIQLWCVKFIYDSFINNTILNHSDKVDLAIDSLDALFTLSNIKDLPLFLQIIDISCIIFKLVFNYVAENDGCNQVWSKLTELKNSLVNKFQSNFPLDPSDNQEHDLSRNIITKIELIKFIFIVIDYQSKSTLINTNNGTPPPATTFSLNSVSPTHSLIKYNNMEYESTVLLDMILKTFNYDILIPQLISSILNHSIIIMRRKPQYSSKILNIIENYDSISKYQSNYQSLEQFKLSKKYVDRIFRIFIHHCLRNNLIPNNYQNSLTKKAQTLQDRGNEIRKKNIFAIEEPNLKKRKFEGFYNPTKRLKVVDYSNLYSLNETNNPLNTFNISTVPQFILNNMVVNALQKSSVSKLSKALEIISDRYINALNTAGTNINSQSATPTFRPPIPNNNINNNNNNNGYQPTQQYQGQLPPPQNQQQLKPYEPPGGYDYTTNGNGNGFGKGGDEYGDEEGEEEDEEDTYDPETIYTLPPPKDLSFQDKKDQINIIIQNFFRLAKNPTLANKVDVDDDEELKIKPDDDENVKVNKELTKIAIKSWKKDSWIILLTRLATRGMRSLTGSSSDEDKISPDDKINQELSDMIRNSIFEYFLENIHGRIDIIIKWLSEEWYSEKVFNEELEIKKAVKLNQGKSVKSLPPIKTPIYNKWAGKVLDAMIPFLEPSDRKIFIRLLSDLPYLNEELVGGIKSLCYDPVRIKIGFLSLQFLIMYRPPVKQACLNILKELSESDQEDLKEEAKKLLDKYN
ncbi:hypothetical protein DFJ63DRAFT_333350 [Scheffersomyces coipomensis]|uniref:uncharacterized protein n=1 Tax=Scheffersomyces coipomensis TaxID=1788519 RepID=UPI00315C7E70